MSNDTEVVPANRSLTPRRFVLREGAMYDTWGRFYIPASMWNRRMREGRSDRYDHDFALGERVFEDDVPSQWHRVRATCSRCGEERLVWHAVAMKDLNRSWCVAPPSFLAVVRNWFTKSEATA